MREIYLNINQTHSIAGVSESPSAGQTVAGSLMSPFSFLSEDSITGLIADTEPGDGSRGDADGIDDIHRPTPSTFSFFPIDVSHPHADFVVGDLKFRTAVVGRAGAESAGVFNLIDASGDGTPQCLSSLRSA